MGIGEQYEFEKTGRIEQEEGAVMHGKCFEMSCHRRDDTYPNFCDSDNAQHPDTCPDWKPEPKNPPSFESFFSHFVDEEGNPGSFYEDREDELHAAWDSTFSDAEEPKHFCHSCKEPMIIPKDCPRCTRLWES